MKSNPNASAFTSNFGWLFADKVTRLVVALVVSAWVARYLGPQRYGVLAYAVAFVSMFQALALLGLDNLVVRDSSAHPNIAHLYLGTAFRLRAIGAVVSYLLLATVSLAINNEDQQTNIVVMLIGLTVIFQVSDVVDLWFQSQVQSRRTVLAKAISYFVAAITKIILIVSGAKIIEFATVNVLEALLSALALQFSYRKFRTEKKWAWDRNIAKNLIKQSWPLLLSGLSIILYMRVSIIFLRDALGAEGVGIYTVGTALSEMWYFIPMAFSSSLAPYISRKRLQGEGVYKRFIYKVFGGMWYFSISIACLNAILAKYWINIIYGAQYERSIQILSLHAFTFIPVCIGVLQSLWLINEGRSKLALYQSIFGAIVAIFSNFVLIKSYGAYGAAISTVVSQFAQAFLVNALLAPDLFKIQCKSLLILSNFSKRD